MRDSRETPNKVSGAPSELYGGPAGGAHGKKDDPERQRRSRHSGPSGRRKGNDLNREKYSIKAPAESRGLSISARQGDELKYAPVKTAGEFQ